MPISGLHHQPRGGVMGAKRPKKARVSDVQIPPITDLGVAAIVIFLMSAFGN
jgi:hypothetical protein